MSAAIIEIDTTRQSKSFKRVSKFIAGACKCGKNKLTNLERVNAFLS